MDLTIESGGLRLQAHLALPSTSPAAGEARRGLIVCHSFPAGPRGAGRTGQTYPQLGERIAADAGWAVLTFNFRGTGESEGDFSLSGWMEDLRNAVDVILRTADVNGVWLAGFGIGGSLAICTAGEDDRVQGVAAFSSPADFSDWVAAPQRFLEHARNIGLVSTPGFPADFDGWTRELRETTPLIAIGKIPPRPVLIVHGSEDDEVLVMDARALADAAEGEVELRVLSGAGHRLRHDPRAVAVLFGWLDRQHI